jgi:hypothetical protein
MNSMRLIKLYRRHKEIIEYRLKKIKECDHVGLYIGDSSAEVYKKIIEIEKTLK